MCHEKLYLSKKISQGGAPAPAEEEEIVDTEDDKLIFCVWCQTSNIIKLSNGPRDLFPVPSGSFGSVFNNIILYFTASAWVTPR